VAGKKWISFALAVLALAAVFYGVRRTWFPRTAIIREDQRALAPDFTLLQLDGQPLRLSDFHGKVVLIDFWASWCVPCREETPHFVQLQNKYGNRGLEIIGISMDDDAEPARKFSEEFHMNYPIVMGNAKIGEAYGGVLGVPIAFLVDRHGRIAAKHTGATDQAVFDREVRLLLREP